MKITLKTKPSEKNQVALDALQKAGVFQVSYNYSGIFLPLRNTLCCARYNGVQAWGSLCTK